MEYSPRAKFEENKEEWDFPNTHIDGKIASNAYSQDSKETTCTDPIRCCTRRYTKDTCDEQGQVESQSSAYDI